MSKQMRSRRGNGEGSIYQRKDGRWTAAVTLLNGKRKQVYGRTRQDVAAKLTHLQTQVANGLPISPDRLTVGHWANQRLESRRSSLKASAIQRYEQLIRNQITPNLGRSRLTSLQVDDLERCYADLLPSRPQFRIQPR